TPTPGTASSGPTCATRWTGPAPSCTSICRRNRPRRLPHRHSRDNSPRRSHTPGDSGFLLPGSALFPTLVLFLIDRISRRVHGAPRRRLPDHLAPPPPGLAESCPPCRPETDIRRMQIAVGLTSPAPVSLSRRCPPVSAPKWLKGLLSRLTP